jgi:hypothetical protein
MDLWAIGQMYSTSGFCPGAGEVEAGALGARYFSGSASNFAVQLLVQKK